MCCLRGEMRKTVGLQKGAQLALVMAMESLFEFLSDLLKEVLKVK